MIKYYFHALRFFIFLFFDYNHKVFIFGLQFMMVQNGIYNNKSPTFSQFFVRNRSKAWIYFKFRFKSSFLSFSSQILFQN